MYPVVRPVVMLLAVMLVAVTLAGCVGNHRPHVAAAPAESLAGDYQLIGRVAGRRLAVAIRFDSTGRAFLLAGSAPAGAFACERLPGVNDRDWQLRCGSVQVQLTVDHDAIATHGTISFDVPTTARRAFDPFTCQGALSENACGPLGRKTRSVGTKRSTGKVAVQRIAAE